MSNKSKEYVYFTDLHDKMVQVTTGLITKTGFKEWLNANVDVKPYLSITTKYALINVFASTFQNKVLNKDPSKRETLDLVYLSYDLAMVFDVMLYYTNICALEDDKNVKNYDLIKQSGLYDFIDSKCNNDYSETVEKCDRLTGVKNVSLMQELLRTFDNFPQLRDVEKMVDLVNNNIDENKLHLLREVEAYNNPTLKQFIDGLSNESVVEEMNKNT